jgi:uncharacterized protein
MTILIVPTLKCNIKCGYCFADGYSWVEQKGYDLTKILTSMETLHNQYRGDHFCLHGGECTLIDINDFETIMKKMYEYNGCTSLQTNGYDISDKMIEIFKKYKTHVGISIDGDGELNSIRGFPNDKIKNRKYTKKVISNIKRLKKEGISVGLIVVLSKANASSVSKLNKLVKFIIKLSNIGVVSGRLNLMWSTCESTKQYELTPEEASFAWIYLYNNLRYIPKLEWNPFRDYTDNLLGFSHSSCSMGKCDYGCTITKVIQYDGTLGNCDRTHQENKLTERSNTPNMDRYEKLREGQCKDCRYWNVCYGGCPAEGMNGSSDKTRFCKAIFDLYSLIELDLKSLLPNVFTVPDFKRDGDYLDNMQKGHKLDAFCKMSWHTAIGPSSWKKYVRPRHVNHTDSNQ